MYRCLAVQRVISEDVDGSSNDVTMSSVVMTTRQRVVNAEDVARSAARWLNNSTHV